jgi:hypothetical protein
MGPVLPPPHNPFQSCFLCSQHRWHTTFSSLHGNYHARIIVRRRSSAAHAPCFFGKGRAPLRFLLEASPFTTPSTPPSQCGGNSTPLAHRDRAPGRPTEPDSALAHAQPRCNAASHAKLHQRRDLNRYRGESLARPRVPCSAHDHFPGALRTAL